MKRILWMSRHEPLGKQVAELKRIFGDDVSVTVDKEPFDGSEEVARRFLAGAYDEIVLVAPLGILASLCRVGFRPLLAEMIACNADDADTEASGRHYKFVRFRRIAKVELVFEGL